MSCRSMRLDTTVGLKARHRARRRRMLFQPRCAMRRCRTNEARCRSLTAGSPTKVPRPTGRDLPVGAAACPRGQVLRRRGAPRHCRSLVVSSPRSRLELATRAPARGGRRTMRLRRARGRGRRDSMGGPLPQRRLSGGRVPLGQAALRTGSSPSGLGSASAGRCRGLMRAPAISRPTTRIPVSTYSAVWKP
jgi:hypothetical protein